MEPLPTVAVANITEAGYIVYVIHLRCHPLRDWWYLQFVHTVQAFLVIAALLQGLAKKGHGPQKQVLPVECPVQGCGWQWRHNMRCHCELRHLDIQVHQCMPLTLRTVVSFVQYPPRKNTTKPKHRRREGMALCASPFLIVFNDRFALNAQECYLLLPRHTAEPYHTHLYVKLVG